MASLHWLSEGWGYDITSVDVYSAYNSAKKAADTLGISDQIEKDIRLILESDKSPGMFVKQVLGRRVGIPHDPI